MFSIEIVSGQTYLVHVLKRIIEKKPRPAEKREVAKIINEEPRVSIHHTCNLAGFHQSVYYQLTYKAKVSIGLLERKDKPKYRV